MSGVKECHLYTYKRKSSLSTQLPQIRTGRDVRMVPRVAAWKSEPVENTTVARSGFHYIPKSKASGELTSTNFHTVLSNAQQNRTHRQLQYYTAVRYYFHTPQFCELQHQGKNKVVDVFEEMQKMSWPCSTRCHIHILIHEGTVETTLCTVQTVYLIVRGYTHCVT